MEEEDSTNQEKEQPNGIKDEKKENIPEGSEGSNEADQKDENLSPEEKIKELEDKLLRNIAEMDNIRKRSEKERTEAYKIGASIFIKEMLPIIDNLQRALNSFSEDENSDPKIFVEGTDAILRDFKSLLEKTGVETINPEGEKFDPNFHEAMFEIPSDEGKPGTIIQVIEQGYILEKRLLRPAKVGVSAKKNEESEN